MHKSVSRICKRYLSKKSKDKNAFQSTLNLPRTDFPMRANAAVRELDYLETLTNDTYNWQYDARANKETFTLHDGPPYANGDLHAGHFLNKILKDIVMRFKLLNGFRIHYVPGWDCHGLPIELKALQSHKDRETMTPSKIRSIAHDSTLLVVQQQATNFKRWGVLAKWGPDGTYRTLDKGYEAKQLEVFGKLVSSGLVTRGLKPVYWSYSSGTALAEAEIEYADNFKSPSIYVDFPLESGNPLFDSFSKAIKATIWTTTPWSLLSNVAISVNPQFEYVLVELPHEDHHLRMIAAGEPLERFLGLYNLTPDEVKIHGTFLGKDLSGIRYRHPLWSVENHPPDTSNMFQTIICGSHVTSDSGTGLVHTAPAHGVEDFSVWQAHGGNLEQCPCPIDLKGCFNEALDNAALGKTGNVHLWKELHGAHVHNGANEVMIRNLEHVLALAVPASVHSHRYPCDWRTKKPIIIRATEQWFVNLDGVRERACSALDGVRLFPESSHSRLESMLEGRSEWCISRQRVWGVPIPALFVKKGDETMSTIMDRFVVAATCEMVAQHGTDWWFSEADVENIIMSKMNALRKLEGLDPIPELKDGERLVRGMDTLDVWFDSGCSWAAVLPDQVRADLYLEGSDQHRGWFQSSLLTKVASCLGGVKPEAPYKDLVTHGFVLDEKQAKMSKSLGNVIVPADVIDGKGKQFGKGPAFGVDVMRLWVASADYAKDISLGVGVVQDASDTLRKIRNTARFLLGNLATFTPSSDYNLTPIDLYMLHRSNRFIEDVTKAYNEYRFRNVYSELVQFMSVDISSVYAPCVKDRLYCDEPSADSRASCQFVLRHLLRTLTLTMAPIIPFTCQDIFEYSQKEVPSVFSNDPSEGGQFTVFQCAFPKSDPKWNLSSEQQESWNLWFGIRNEFNRILSGLQSRGAAQSSEELVVTIDLSQPVNDPKLVSQTLENLLMVSSVSLDSVQAPSSMDDDVQFESFEFGNQMIRMLVKRSSNAQCPRCWRYTSTSSDSLCGRCLHVIDKTRPN